MFPSTENSEKTAKTEARPLIPVSDNPSRSSQVLEQLTVGLRPLKRKAA